MKYILIGALGFGCVPVLSYGLAWIIHNAKVVQRIALLFSWKYATFVCVTAAFASVGAYLGLLVAWVRH